MNNFDNALENVKNELYSEPLVKEYFRIKSIVESDEEIISLEKNVKEHQKKMCENINSDEVYLKEKNLYEKAVKSLNSHPVYSNYLKLKEEILLLLNEIKEVLEWL